MFLVVKLLLLELEISITTFSAILGVVYMLYMYGKSK